MLRRLKRTKRPVVLTVNGKAELVVQDAASYQRLLELVERFETLAAIQEAIEDERAGRHKPAEEVFAAVRRRYHLTAK